MKKRLRPLGRGKRQGKRKTISLLLLTSILLPMILSALPFTVNADSPQNDGLFPSPKELGYDIETPLYDKYPSSHYTFDTVHKWLYMEGWKPAIGPADELLLQSQNNGFISLVMMMTRLNIFLLQIGFQNEFFDDFIDQLDVLVSTISTYAYENLFWFISLVLAGIVIVKYANGRKGEMAYIILRALIVSAIMFGIIANIGWFIHTATGFVDMISMMILGIMSFNVSTGHGAVADGTQQILQLSNNIFEWYALQPWEYGQMKVYGDANIPRVHEEEVVKLSTYGLGLEEKIVWGSSWKDAFLSYHSSSVERKALVEVFANENIRHNTNWDSLFLKEGGASRFSLLIISFIANLVAAVLFGVVAILLVGGKIGLIVMTPLLTISALFAFFGNFGMRVIQVTLSIWLFCASMKIAASIYIGVPITGMSALSLMSTDTKVSLLIVMFLYIVITVIGILFLPLIWKRIQPMIMKAVSGAIETVNRIGKVNVSRGTWSSGRRRGRFSLPLMPVEKNRSRFRRSEYRKQDQGMSSVTKAYMKSNKEISQGITELRKDLKKSHQDPAAFDTLTQSINQNTEALDKVKDTIERQDQEGQQVEQRSNQIERPVQTPSSENQSIGRKYKASRRIRNQRDAEDQDDSGTNRRMRPPTVRRFIN